MSLFSNYITEINRRSFLRKTLSSLGVVALGDLFSSDSLGNQSQNLSDGLHYPAKVKRIIHLCMAGGPSHLETFDYKPALEKHHGQPMPESFTAGQQIAQLQSTELKVKGPTFKFSRHGKSGMEMSECFPHIASLADEIAVIRSMYTEQINHDPAHTFMNTGSIIPGRPSMGAWTNYGLGSLSNELPGLWFFLRWEEDKHSPFRPANGTMDSCPANIKALSCGLRETRSTTLEILTESVGNPKETS